MKLSKTEDTLATAAAKAGMDEKTARKWSRIGRQPSEVKKTRTYRTRPDTFAEAWPEIEQLLELDASIEAKSIFDHLCRQSPEKYQESQLRTLQRRVKVWRAQKGQPREVFFPQSHVPGRQAQSAVAGVCCAALPAERCGDDRKLDLRPVSAQAVPAGTAAT
jgi:hypothetical protein